MEEGAEARDSRPSKTFHLSKSMHNSADGSSGESLCLATKSKTGTEEEFIKNEPGAYPLLKVLKINNATFSDSTEPSVTSVDRSLEWTVMNIKPEPDDQPLVQVFKSEDSIPGIGYDDFEPTIGPDPACGELVVHIKNETTVSPKMNVLEENDASFIGSSPVEDRPLKDAKTEFSGNFYEPRSYLTMVEYAQSDVGHDKISRNDRAYLSLAHSNSSYDVKSITFNLVPFGIESDKTQNVAVACNNKFKRHTETELIASEAEKESYDPDTNHGATRISSANHQTPNRIGAAERKTKREGKNQTIGSLTNDQTLIRIGTAKRETKREGKNQAVGSSANDQTPIRICAAVRKTKREGKNQVIRTRNKTFNDPTATHTSVRTSIRVSATKQKKNHIVKDQVVSAKGHISGNYAARHTSSTEHQTSVHDCAKHHKKNQQAFDQAIEADRKNFDNFPAARLTLTRERASVKIEATEPRKKQKGKKQISRAEVIKSQDSEATRTSPINDPIPSRFGVTKRKRQTPNRRCKKETIRAKKENCNEPKASKSKEMRKCMRQHSGVENETSALAPNLKVRSLRSTVTSDKATAMYRRNPSGKFSSKDGECQETPKSKAQVSRSKAYNSAYAKDGKVPIPTSQHSVTQDVTTAMHHRNHCGKLSSKRNESQEARKGKDQVSRVEDDSAHPRNVSVPTSHTVTFDKTTGLSRCNPCRKLFSRKENAIKHLLYSCEAAASRKKKLAGVSFGYVSRTPECFNGAKKERPWCRKCRKYFSCPDSLQKHMKSVHGRTRPAGPERTFECGECGKSYLSRDYLKVHLARHRQWANTASRVCGVCRASFADSYSFSRHMRWAHRPAPKPLSSTLRPSCEGCGSSFSKSSCLTKHLKRPGIRDFTVTKAGRKCDVCGRVFSREAFLKCHLVSRFRSDGKVCRLCCAYFDEPRELDDHCRSEHPKIEESDEKNAPREPESEAFVVPPVYSCHHCGVGYRKKGYLSNHIHRRCAAIEL
ncbi:unnamed protein product [Bemisia tabaci]|uniref:C2H2-type domain-containing protein n=1 Tax=Bemisia tabaci TaxID=7038 RepID=A0A9P0F107_BEMTA|nr:unnamed protein product [Bemisia tabaci]